MANDFFRPCYERALPMPLPRKQTVTITITSEDVESGRFNLTVSYDPPAQENDEDNVVIDVTRMFFQMLAEAGAMETLSVETQDDAKGKVN